MQGHAKAWPATLNNLEKVKEELKKELLEQLCKEAKRKEAADLSTLQNTLVFSRAILVTSFPYNFKIPNIIAYNWKEDPTARVEVFCT